VAELTPRQNDHAVRLLPTPSLHLNAPPATPKHWGPINPNLNDYHTNPMEISSTFWLPDITDWWRQQEETHSRYTDLSNGAHDMFSIVPHVVGVQASISVR